MQFFLGSLEIPRVSVYLSIHSYFLLISLPQHWTPVGDIFTAERDTCYSFKNSAALLGRAGSLLSLS